MLFRGKRVRSVDKYLAPLAPNTKIRVVVEVAAINAPPLAAIGFSANPLPGETVLPASLGRVSEFNANGRHEPQKHLPKVSTYITTIEWSWEVWAGRGTETRTEFRDVFRDCYPRIFVPPPAAELSIVNDNGALLIVSEEIDYTATSRARILHIVNLMLELFGHCEARHANLQRIIPPAIRKVNWTMLPPGQYPWPQVQQHVRQVVGNLSPRYANPILGRMQVLVGHNPDQVYVGQGGYRAYIAYIFNSKNLAVLESIMLDNATYVFGQNWQQVSQLTKAEVLGNNLQQVRLIHGTGWQDRINQLLN